MRQSMKVGFVVLLLIGVLGVLQPAWSQEVTAAIVGTVTDPSGAPITGIRSRFKIGGRLKPRDTPDTRRRSAEFPLRY